MIILSLALPVYLCMSNLTWQKNQNLKPQTQLNMLFSLGRYRLLVTYYAAYFTAVVFKVLFYSLKASIIP